MKLFSILFLFLFSFFNEKQVIPASKPSFTATFKFRTMKGIPGLPSSVSTKSTSIKYKFKNDENLNSYHNIKLQSINLNGAGVNSYAGYLKSVKIFFSTRSKRELEISSTLLTNTSMQDYILNVNDKEILDEYLKDPDLEYSIEYVLDTAFQDLNYRVDFKFIGEPVNKQETK